MIKPLHDNVVVEVLSDDKTSAKGIILKTGSDEERNGTRGRVVAVGDGILYKETQTKPVAFAVKAGDVVYFKEYSGTSLTQGDKTLKVLPYEDLIAVEA